MDAKVFVGTYARAPLVLASGKGCKLYDVEGREYLDMTAGIAVNALGHGDPEWVRAVTEQAGVLTHVSNIFYSKFPVKEISLSSWLIQCSSSTHCYLVGCCYSHSFIISCYGMHLQLMVVLIECFVTCCLCICLSESDCYKHQFTAG